MEISQKYLNKLKGWEYEEYKNLSEKDFDGKKYTDFGFAHKLSRLKVFCFSAESEVILKWKR